MRDVSGGSKPRPRLTRAEAKARTRAELLDAAAEVFARKGYVGASVEEIAEEAGFSTGALYSNFSSKQDLFLALLAQRAQNWVSEARGIVGSDGPVQHRRTALGEALVNVADKETELAVLRAEFWLYAVRNPDVMPTLAALRRGNDEAVEQLIVERLPELAKSRPEWTSQSAIVVTALFEGLVWLRRLDPDRVGPGLYGQALGWLFTGMNAEAGAARPGGNGGDSPR
jgi:AcrR family transcriptional regulator